ncbi:DnaD domain protein [Enterococcus faecalis]|jgi:DnaD/phage-associated family protein|uniref:DnaD domain protein n=5 Tax=Enterococcus faecalis TaxID=1351 RepID=UPI00115A65D7|nr:DnaD domain protein [Enterococcus faecalis]UYY06089.1 DnaD domain protein [Enterococcus faecalis]
MNDSYFPHDSNARNSDKLIPVRMKYGAEGYGIYFMILERLREEKNYMSIRDYNTLAFDLRVDTSKIKAIVEDFGLFTFTEDGECFYSEGFNKRMEYKDAKSKKRSEAGKKGAAKRWQQNSKAIAMPLDENSITKNANAIAKEKNSKERKEKERKEKESKVNKSKVNKKETESSINPSSPETSVEKAFFEEPLGEEKLTELIRYYSQNVSPATPVNITDLQYDLADFDGDLELLKEAVNICARNNERRYSYFAGILKNWRANGVKTYADYLNNERERADKKTQNKQYQNKPVRQEKVPEWMNQANGEEEKLSPEEQAEFERQIQELSGGE